MNKEQVLQVFIVVVATVISCIVLVKEYSTAPIEITQISYNVTSLPEGVIVNEYSESESDEPASEPMLASQTESSALFSESETIDYPININTATAEELDALPRIGPVLAERIIAYREENNGFYDIEEIMDVSGIGESTFSEIRPYITVE